MRRTLGIGFAVLVMGLVAAGLVYANSNLHSSPETSAEPTPPATCTLSAHPAYYYANNPVDAAKAGAGSEYKVSADAFGPSAIPYNYEGPSTQALYAVQRMYLSRLCGYGGPGGDKSLLKTGYAALDVHHKARMATHADMNPNVLMADGDMWRQYLKDYLGALRWDKSRLEDRPAQVDAWTAVATPGDVPKVRAVQRTIPATTYLMLVISQPDGTDYTFPLELVRGFQPVYASRDDVPAVLVA
jgi:hypothetical protein